MKKFSVSRVIGNTSFEESLATMSTESQPVYQPKGRYVQIRAGLLEHMQTGRLTPKEFAVIVSLIILADAATGV